MVSPPAKVRPQPVVVRRFLAAAVPVVATAAIAAAIAVVIVVAAVGSCTPLPSPSSTWLPVALCSC